MNRRRPILLLLCLAFSWVTTPAAAQAVPTIASPDASPPGDELTPAQDQALWSEIQRNVAALRSQHALAEPDLAQTVTFNFPLRLAPGLPDYAGFRISAFMDHNSASGQVADYTGGARTYDGHRGTDIALWPFGWNKVDAGAMQVIAAAAGTIVGYANVNPADHNCGASSSGDWNYVALVHADGRLTIYGHMRYNSLTPKGLGQLVAQGEYLGTAASSGNSSGPHLHFEVRANSSSQVGVDPYTGPNSQPQSMWASQPPYYDSAINRLGTHSSPPATPDPCQPTQTHLEDNFTTPANIYFYAYYRDYQGGLVTQFSLYRPDGSLYQAWQDTPGDPTFHSAMYRAQAFAFTNNDPAGTWRFAAQYNGQVYETYFNVNAPPIVTLISPNGGEQWAKLLPHSIIWTDNLGGQVNIALYHNGVFSTALAYNSPSDGEYDWMPAAALAPGPGYAIRVTSVTGPAFDASNAPFTLTSTPLAAHNDLFIIPDTAPVTLDMLANDDSPPGEPITITAFGPPLSGTVGLAGAQLVYTPTLGLFGQDVFTYTVSTSTDQSSATVTVLIVPDVFRVFLPAARR